MHSTSVLTFLALAGAAVAQSSNPVCVASCIQSSPVSSQCDGDETGTALAQCTCASLQGSLLLACIKRCTADDQTVYAGKLPPACASQLFPALATGGGSSSTATPTGASTDASTSTTSSGSSPTGGAASSTSASATQSSTRSGSFAAPTAVPNMLAGGIAAAMLFL